MVVGKRVFIELHVKEQLTAQHGPNISLGDLLDCLVSGCPYRQPTWERQGDQYVPRCHAYFPDLYGAAKDPSVALPLQRPE